MLVATEDRVNHGNLSKIDRYGWVSHGSPGEFRWINKAEIAFDPDYQRELSHAKVLDIASNWSWVAFGCVVVALREGAPFAIDGMHRICAARRRSDVDMLPCMVFQTAHKADEAGAFLRINKNRRGISTFDTHRAMILSGDPIAVHAQFLLDSNGLAASRSSDAANSLGCIGSLHRLVANKRAYLDEVFPLVVAVCNGAVVKERLLEGLVYLQENADESLTSPRWRKRILDVGYDDLLRGCVDGALYFSRGGAKSWAYGMLQRINKGMRNRLRMRGSDE